MSTFQQIVEFITNFGSITKGAKPLNSGYLLVAPDSIGSKWQEIRILVTATLVLTFFIILNQDKINAVRGPTRNKALIPNSSEHPPIHCCQFRV